MQHSLMCSPLPPSSLPLHIGAASGIAVSHYGTFPSLLLDPLIEDSLDLGVKAGLDRQAALTYSPPPPPPPFHTGAASGIAVTHYGTFPSLLLDPLIEHILDLVGAKQDLTGMQRSLSNAYSLYLKTRPAASSESVRRAKQLQPEGCHPLLLAAVKHKTGGQVDMQVSDCVSVTVFACFEAESV